MGNALSAGVRLVHPQRAGRGKRTDRFGHRRLQGTVHLAVDLRARPDADAQPHQLIEQRLRAILKLLQIHLSRPCGRRD